MSPAHTIATRESAEIDGLAPPEGVVVEEDQLPEHLSGTTSIEQPSLGSERTLPSVSKNDGDCVKAASPSEDEPIYVTMTLSDPDHPNNWPSRRKLFILIAGILSVINSTLGSSLPSNAITYIAKTFNVTNELQLVLPISTYLIGFIIGPTLCGPISEFHGRRPVMIYSFIGFTSFTLGCALAPNWPTFLVFRMICGLMGAAPIATVGGLYADVYGNPRERGVAMAWFMAATTFGPCIAPAISGFISENTTWRWVWW